MVEDIKSYEIKKLRATNEALVRSNDELKKGYKRTKEEQSYFKRKCEMLIELLEENGIDVPHEILSGDA